MVELLPESQWKSESTRLPSKAAADIMAGEESADGKNEEEEAGDSEFCQVGSHTQGQSQTGTECDVVIDRATIVLSKSGCMCVP